MAATAPRTHFFSFILDGADELTAETADAFVEAGCDDATPVQRCDVLSLSFDRKAPTFGGVVASARSNAERSGPRLRITRAAEKRSV